MLHSPANADALFQLLDAIVADDRAAVASLLKSNPSLATQPLKKPILETRLPHWLYVGDTALHAAAAGHRFEISRLLLKSGADVRAHKNHRAAQPLHYAADGCPGNPLWDVSRQVKTIQLLLESGADINAADKNGATPLHRAVRTRCADAVKILLASGADFKLRNKPGSTPFHLAVQNTGRGGSGVPEAKAAQLEIIQHFLAHRAKPTLPDAAGKTVLAWAKSPAIKEALLTKETNI